MTEIDPHAETKYEIQQGLTAFRTTVFLLLLSIIGYSWWALIFYGVTPVIVIGGFLLLTVAALILSQFTVNVDYGPSSWLQLFFKGYYWLLISGQAYSTKKYFKQEDLEQLPGNSFIRLTSFLVLVKSPKVAVQLRLTIE